MDFLFLLGCLLSLCSLPQLSSAREAVDRNEDKVKLTCPFLTVDGVNYIYYPYIKYQTLIDGKSEEFNIIGPNTDTGNNSKRQNKCAEINLKNEEKSICERLVPKIKEINRFGQGENARIVFEFEVSNDDGGNKLMCKSGLVVKQPPGTEDEIDITVVNDSTLKLDTSGAAFSAFGIDQGQAIEATCYVQTTGTGDAPLWFQVETDSGWEDLTVSRISSRSIHLVNEIAERKHDGKKLRCVLGHSRNNVWTSRESLPMQVRFKPYGLTANVGSMCMVVSSNGSMVRKNIVCTAQEGNPPDVVWSVYAIVNGLLNTDVIKNQVSSKLSYSFDVLVQKDLEVYCLAQNEVGAAEFEIQIGFSTKSVFSGIKDMFCCSC